jgi:uncharacterized protein YyaL (SSP411 family)
VTAWNAEAVAAFLALSQYAGRKDVADAALRALEFMRQRFVTEKGVFHIYEYKTGRGYLRGQLEANAWAARAFLEGYRLSKQPHYLQAAQNILSYLKTELYDEKRGAFIGAKNPDPPDKPFGAADFPLGANGVVADAYLLAYKLTGRSEYRQVGQRVLEAFGGEVKAILSDDGDMASPNKVVDSIFYLRAYGRLFEGS